jgi:cytoskeletal protein CcmA (bactofilin family)
VRRRHHTAEADPDGSVAFVPTADAPVRIPHTPTLTDEAKEVRMAGSDDSQVSVVSRGTKIEGSVMAAGSLRVEGEVHGKITAKGQVSLSPDGQVEANIKAESIVLAGRVKGDLEASGDVSLPAESRLDGNIRARNADVGGTVDGNVTVTGRASLGPRARVDGDIASSSLAISEGAVFIGRSNMGGQDHGADEARAKRPVATSSPST